MAMCLRRVLDCLQGPSDGATTSYSHLDEVPSIKLDTTRLGTDVVVVKNGQRVCGTGAVLANAPIVQNKAYFEIKLQQSGVWGVGLSNKKTDLNKVPLGQDENSWVLRHDGNVYTGGEVVASLNEAIEEGDVVGLSYDHVELCFYKNGTKMDMRVAGIKGTYFPVLYVDDGSILDVQFKNFWHDPPSGFEEIMMEQTLL